MRQIHHVELEWHTAIRLHDIARDAVQTMENAAERNMAFDVLLDLARAMEVYRSRCKADHDARLAARKAKKP